MLGKIIAALAVSLVSASMAVLADDAEPSVPTMTINELMETVVTPVTNTLWGIEDPQSDEEWQVFVDAADEIIEAGRIIKAGGTGPNDNEWASNPDWQAFADQLIGAGEVARKAAQAQDLEGMWTAGEVLYPPCEECHLQFHPEMQ